MWHVPQIFFLPSFYRFLIFILLQSLISFCASTQSLEFFCLLFGKDARKKIRFQREGVKRFSFLCFISAPFSSNRFIWSNYQDFLLLFPIFYYGEMILNLLLFRSRRKREAARREAARKAIWILGKLRRHSERNNGKSFSNIIPQKRRTEPKEQTLVFEMFKFDLPYFLRRGQTHTFQPSPSTSSDPFSHAFPKAFDFACFCFSRQLTGTWRHAKRKV